MSNIFAPLVRPFGTLPVELGSGPVVDGTEYMHMWIDFQGSLLVSNDAIHHYGAALPFDVNGRVVVSASPVVRWDQDIPFTASGAVAMLESPDLAHWDQGLVFTESGHIATGDVAPPPTAPIWSEIPPTQNYLYELPVDYDVSPYVSDAGDPITSYALIGAPDFFTIDTLGVITAGVGTAAAAHVLTVEATNGVGSSQTTFTWTLLTGNVPTWETIPDQAHRENLLPKTLDVAPYATSDSGPILSYNLVTPPSGFSISGSVVTVSAGTAVGSYPITAQATNGVGAGNSLPFTWDILEELIPPVWEAIPDTTNTQGDLPVGYDVSPYVTTNSGPLTGWRLVTPPVGFTISAVGVVTCAIGTALATHVIAVAVSNDQGESSQSFNWQISDTLLPPQWSPIPAQSDREDDLPQTLDTDPYVTSNDGPLANWSLVAPPAGFTIDGAGVVTAAAGIPPGTHSNTVRVDNNTGTSDSDPFDWEIGSFFLPPQWSTIPPQSTEEQLLPVVLDVKPYVTSNHGPLTGWSLVSPPSGWTIDSDGIITVAAARPVGTNSITVRVSNDSGSADSAAFQWDILEEPLVPQWTTIPNQQTREDVLPQNLDVSPWVTSNAGSLTAWELVAPPIGFTINTAGVITAAAGTTVAIYSLTVRVSNDIGSGDSAPFTWEIQEELLSPQWDTVPDKSDRINTLPQNYDMSFYVTSNAGPLILWRLASSPSGFSISSTTGIITATAGAGLGDHSLRVGVTNSVGESLSNTFEWQILEELLPPQWSTIPPRSDDDTTLPQNYDVSGYVTSNSGPLDTWSLTTAPAGFTINQSGVITASTSAPETGNSITVQVFNDEGGAQSAAFIWTIVNTNTDEVLHDFNADLGLWEHKRVGSAWGYDKDEIDHEVGTDVAVYEGCGWSGSVFTPDAGFAGIRIDAGSTNVWTYSNNILHSTWTVYQASRTATTFILENASTTQLYKNTSLGAGTANWVLSVEGRTIVSYSGDITMGPNSSDVTDPLPFTSSLAQLWHRFSPSVTLNQPGMSGASASGEVYVQYFQAENGGYGGPTGPILTNGTSVTRNPPTLTSTMADYGWEDDDFVNGFCAQFKIISRMDNSVSTVAPGNYITIYATINNDSGSVSSTDYCLLRIRSNSEVRFLVRRNNSTAKSTTPTVTLLDGEEYNIRIRVNPAVGIRIWIDGPGANVDQANDGAFTSWSTLVPNKHRLGTFNEPGDDNDEGAGAITIKSVRLNRTVLPDSEIEAWT